MRSGKPWVSTEVTRVARSQSSRAQTVSAAAGVQRAGVVGAVREAYLGPAFKADGLGCSVGMEQATVAMVRQHSTTHRCSEFLSAAHNFCANGKSEHERVRCRDEVRGSHLDT